MPLLPAFAKLNLGLKVLFKRPDNFHEIATVFQAISLADSLSVTATRAAKTTIEVESDTEIPGENLAANATRLFLGSAGIAAQVHIRIAKRSPIGGRFGPRPLANPHDRVWPRSMPSTSRPANRSNAGRHGTT